MPELDQANRDALQNRLRASDQGWFNFEPGSDGYATGFFDLLGRILMLSGAEEIIYLSSKAQLNLPAEIDVVAFTPTRVILASARITATDSYDYRKWEIEASTFARAQLREIEIVDSGLHRDQVRQDAPQVIRVSFSDHESITLPLSGRPQQGADGVWDLFRSLVGELGQ